MLLQQQQLSASANVFVWILQKQIQTLVSKQKVAEVVLWFSWSFCIYSPLKCWLTFPVTKSWKQEDSELKTWDKGWNDVVHQNAETDKWRVVKRNVRTSCLSLDNSTDDLKGDYMKTLIFFLLDLFPQLLQNSSRCKSHVKKVTMRTGGKTT